MGSSANLETSAALPDEIERGVDVAKDLFMMSGNVAIRRDLFLTSSEIVGNLEVLEEKGLIARRGPDPFYRWELCA